MERRYTLPDRLVLSLDQAVRTLFGRPVTTERQDPARAVPEGQLSQWERDQGMRLMRVNHTGEVCAQALYQGQALTAREARVRRSVERSAAEENDHLAWCADRVRELDGRTSVLNPLFYAGSLAVGTLAGLAGDRWSLGFVAETERQVVEHLQGHLQRLPKQDKKSRAVVEQMKEDEARHATMAVQTGAAPFPGPLKTLMRLSSRVMTRSVFWF